MKANNIKSISQRVHFLLKEKKETRDNNAILITTYYRKHHPEVKSLQDYLTFSNKKHIPSIATIERRSRYWQNKDKSVRGKGWAKRKRLEQIVRKEINK